jgi:CheY-like chemotaxis protein
MIASGSQLSEKKGGEWILVVDDEKSIRRVLATVLEHGGYHVLQASDAQTALEAFGSAPSGVQLVLTDLSMPGTDGFALIRSLKSSAPGVPILAMTGMVGTGGEVYEKLLELDADGLLLKPFSQEDVLKEVDLALHGHSQNSK